MSVWVTNTWRDDFVYDGLLRKRIERDYSWNGSSWIEESEVRFVYDGNVVIQERDANNLSQVTYTRGLDLSGDLQEAGGIGGLLARTVNPSTLNPQLSANATAYYHCDGNGNITCMVDSNGRIVAHYEYDPFGNAISVSGPLAGANAYRFSSKEWNENTGLYYYLYRFYNPDLLRWPNRDPMGEPGFETLHLVTQPLFIRKLRLNINDAEMQYFLAMAIQDGSINLADYLSSSHAAYTGNAILLSEFFNFLRSGQAIYAPNWPVELLENPNLFDFVGNDPINDMDPNGLVWHWVQTTWNWINKHILEPLEVAGEHGLPGDVGPGLGALKCGPFLYDIYTNEPPKYRMINDPDNPTNPVSGTAG